VPIVSAPGGSNSGSYSISWTAVGTATSYTLQEQVNGGAWTTIQSNGATSAALSGKGNATYGYHVQACNAGGCGPWSITSNVSVVLIPATPSTPSVSVSGPYFKPVVTVSWPVVPNATRYEVEEVHPQDGPLTIYMGSAPSFGGVIFASGTVKFRVMACSSAGCSAYSNYASVMLHSGNDAIP
jgi:hypothetical protein